MKKYTWLTFAFLYLLCAQATSYCSLDENRKPITQAVLISKITNTPLTSAEHRHYIIQAQFCGFAKEAYDRYSDIWQMKRTNFYANLWFGEAAESYLRTLVKPHVYAPESLLNDLDQTARRCLITAVTQQPKSADANLAYGHYLFWWASQMKLGLQYMQKAVEIDPRNVSAHAVLGDAYAEHSGDAYNLPKAEQELKIVLALKPSDAFAHFRLVRVYLDLHRYQDAEQELKAYKSLVPSNFAMSSTVYYQRELDSHRL